MQFWETFTWTADRIFVNHFIRSVKDPSSANRSWCDKWFQPAFLSNIYFYVIPEKEGRRESKNWLPKVNPVIQLKAFTDYSNDETGNSPFLKEKISFLSNLIIYVVYLGHVTLLRRKANIISAFLPILERRRFPHETKDKRLLRDKVRFFTFPSLHVHAQRWTTKGRS